MIALALPPALLAGAPSRLDLVPPVLLALAVLASVPA